MFYCSYHSSPATNLRCRKLLIAYTFLFLTYYCLRQNLLLGGFFQGPPLATWLHNNMSSNRSIDIMMHINGTCKTTWEGICPEFTTWRESWTTLNSHGLSWQRSQHKKKSRRSTRGCSRGMDLVMANVIRSTWRHASHLRVSQPLPTWANHSSMGCCEQCLPLPARSRCWETKKDSCRDVFGTS